MHSTLIWMPWRQRMSPRCIPLEKLYDILPDHHRRMIRVLPLKPMQALGDFGDSPTYRRDQFAIKRLTFRWCHPMILLVHRTLNEWLTATERSRHDVLWLNVARSVVRMPPFKHRTFSLFSHWTPFKCFATAMNELSYTMQCWNSNVQSIIRIFDLSHIESATDWTIAQ